MWRRILSRFIKWASDVSWHSLREDKLFLSRTTQALQRRKSPPDFQQPTPLSPKSSATSTSDAWPRSLLSPSAWGGCGWLSAQISELDGGGLEESAFHEWGNFPPTWLPTTDGQAPSWSVATQSAVDRQDGQAFRLRDGVRLICLCRSWWPPFPQ